VTHLVTRLHTSDYALDVGTHQCQRRRRIDICQSNFRCLAVEHGDESSAHHSDESERLVLVLSRGDLHNLSAADNMKMVNIYAAYRGTYRDPHEYQDIRADQTITNISSLRRLGLLGKGDSPINQEWLAKVEADQTNSGRHHRQDRPFEPPQGSCKERMRAGACY
jgi:hypothetical protein